MTSKTDSSRWRPSFEKARGRVLIEKLMAGGSYGGNGGGDRDGGGVDREVIKRN